jgi:hypothetical protein
VPLERAELRAPLGLQLIEERLHSDKRLGLQLEQPDACVLRNTLIFDDPRREKDLQVPAHRWLGHAGRDGELTGTMRSLAEQLHHLTSSWIGERLKHIHYELIVH